MIGTLYVSTDEFLEKIAARTIGRVGSLSSVGVRCLGLVYGGDVVLGIDAIVGRSEN